MNLSASKYTPLSKLDKFRTGYIIIENTLFSVDKGSVSESWDLENNDLGAKIAEARAVAELSNTKRIIFDDEGYYDSDTVLDEGELITAYEAFRRMSKEDQDDYNSFAEHLMEL